MPRDLRLQGWASSKQQHTSRGEGLAGAALQGQRVQGGECSQSCQAVVGQALAAGQAQPLQGAQAPQGLQRLAAGLRVCHPVSQLRGLCSARPPLQAWGIRCGRLAWVRAKTSSVSRVWPCSTVMAASGRPVHQPRSSCCRAVRPAPSTHVSTVYPGSLAERRTQPSASHVWR